ncbi:collagen alpha-1(I) chain isoform X3 [Drosophila rhopaloa]|uniref:Collagen alpha-1(I) chain isoform X3 n=1 Tax=Drosophila rhopaloa TaxID=1041015 RepID=A0A6P4F3Y4_DRORH|nr:collagen alpha-1(I) chain isoform X3 [Drosophila rhopaloa]
MSEIENSELKEVKSTSKVMENKEIDSENDKNTGILVREEEEAEVPKKKQKLDEKKDEEEQRKKETKAEEFAGKKEIAAGEMQREQCQDKSTCRCWKTLKETPCSCSEELHSPHSHSHSPLPTKPLSGSHPREDLKNNVSAASEIYLPLPGSPTGGGGHQGQPPAAGVPGAEQGHRLAAVCPAAGHRSPVRSGLLGPAGGLRGQPAATGDRGKSQGAARLPRHDGQLLGGSALSQLAKVRRLSIRALVGRGLLLLLQPRVRDHSAQRLAECRPSSRSSRGGHVHRGGGRTPGGGPGQRGECEQDGGSPNPSVRALWLRGMAGQRGGDCGPAQYAQSLSLCPGTDDRHGITCVPWTCLLVRQRYGERPTPVAERAQLAQCGVLPAQPWHPDKLFLERGPLGAECRAGQEGADGPASRFHRIGCLRQELQGRIPESAEHGEHCGQGLLRGHLCTWLVL